MTIRKLDKGEWQWDFDALSHSLEGKQAEVEVASLKLGDGRPPLGAHRHA